MRTAKMTWALRIGLMAATGVLVAWRISSAVIAPGRNVDGPVASPVVATVETVPVRSGGDAADDAAIWLHPTDGSQSTIIGTDKKKGLVVYDLTGRELQYLPDGKLVNVDLRHDFPLDNRHTSIVASGGRGNHGIAVYAIDESTRLLRNVSAGALKVGVQVYGSCMYRSPVTGSHYVFVTSKSGEVEQWQLFETVPGQVGARRVRSFDVGSQVEGCVADDELGSLYVGEEDVGIWKYAAEPTTDTERTLVDSTSSTGHLTADVEGLTLSYGPEGRGYLIASSQGSDEFVVYRRTGENEYLATFQIVEGNGIDRVTHSDGIDVLEADLGPGFPRGVFVTQDQRNDGAHQNFKLVPWQDIEALILGGPLAKPKDRVGFDPTPRHVAGLE